MKYILTRILGLIPVLLGISLVAFLLGIIMPGDPAEIALSAGGAYSPSAEQIEIQREKMGLNEPYSKQYINWLNNALKLDLGKSFDSKSPVKEELKFKFPNTLKLAFISMTITIVLGVGFGILSALFEDSLLDRILEFLSVVLISTPTFWIAIILIAIFSENLGVLPTSGANSLKHFIMPSLCLSFTNIGGICRLTRSSILNELESQYILVARSKGISEYLVVVKHAFRNSLILIISSLGSRFGNMLGGSVLVENIFAINGIGKFAIDSIGVRDYPALQGYVLVTGFTFVIVNIMVDIIYYFANPNINLGGENE